MAVVTVCPEMGVGITVGRSRKAAEDRLWIEIERDRQCPMEKSMLEELLIMKVARRDFFAHLSPQAQFVYRRGLGVVWPLDGRLIDIDDDDD